MALTNPQGKLILSNEAGQVVNFPVIGTSFSSTGSLVTSTIPTSGLVSYWKLDESSLAVGGIKDSAYSYIGAGSNPANNGTRFGTAPITVTGRVGNGQNFSGDDYVRIPYNSNLSSTAVSISLWVYFPTGFTSGKSFFVLTENSGGPVPINFVTRSGVFTFGSANTAGTNQELQGTAAIPLDQWVHFVVTHDGSTKKIYQNGVLDTSVAQTGLYALSTQDLGFGAHLTDLIADSATLSMDEVIWYNRALSAGEVTQIYQSYFTPVVITGLEGWWPLMHNTNDIALAVGSTDGFNPAKNATLQGAASISNGLVLSGADANYASVSSVPNTASVTLECWVNFTSFAHNEVVFYKVNFEEYIAAFSDASSVLGTDSGCGDSGGGTASSIQGLANDFTTSTWTHFVGTFGSGSRKIYINGSLRYQDTGVTKCSTGSSNMLIGGYTLATNNNVIGTMRDVRIYNIALSPAQILQNYRAGMSV